MNKFNDVVLAYYDGEASKGEVFGWAYEVLEDQGEIANVDDILVLLPNSLMDEFIEDIINVAESDKELFIMWSSGPAPKKMPFTEAAIKKWCNKNHEEYNKNI